MKPYPVYKDSGIEWIGNIPKTWQVKRLKFLCSLINQPGTVNGNGKRIDLENIESWTGKIKPNGSDISIADDEMKTYKLGDVLFSKLRPYLAKVYKARENGICGGELLVLRPGKEMRSGFVFYRTISNDFIRIVDGSTYGTKMPRADWDFISNLFIGYPDPETQEIVAAFLDLKTAQIDDLIAQKERMIELLKEERMAVINQAVTRGLDPNVELKDSGIEWLGKIPKHWKIVRLRFLCDITTGDKDTVDRDDEGTYPFFVRSPIVEHISTYSFDGEAVLTAGDGVGVGKVFHYYRGKFDFHQRVYMFFNFCKVTGKYFFYYLRTNLHKVVCRGQAKSTVDSIRLPFLQDFPVVLSDGSEQGKIILFIEEKLQQIDDQVEREKRSIELLREFRAALISEVVTGKIDVGS